MNTVGKVHVLSGPKKFKSSDGKELTKQECRIGDSCAAIGITLWENAIGQIKDECYYKICNARVRSYQGVKYLSVNTETTFTETNDQFPIVSDLYASNESNIDKTLTIDTFMGVQAVSRYSKCRNCNKRLNQLQCKVVACEMCGLRQILSTKDKCYISVAALVDEMTILRFQDKELKDLLDIFNNHPDTSTPVDLETASESEIIESFLSVANIKIIYNSTTKIVSSVELLQK